jgi:ATP-binding cassette subfamily B protein
VRLLLRFYDPREGTIRIGGQDIRSASQASVRAAIGVVPQDAVLFNDTIGRNIAYGRFAATQAEIEQTARLASLDSFIEKLPDRYETLVGERGLKLSGGERQRVAIARVILKSPPILVLDEATSSLDTRTEQEIQQSLNQVSHSRTTLVIAHRLSTVVDADDIIVLANGHVIEQGDHRTLLARKGTYAAMWREQQSISENVPGYLSSW